MSWEYPHLKGFQPRHGAWYGDSFFFSAVSSDDQKHRILQINRDGNIANLAGSSKGFQDGPKNTAKFDGPTGLAITVSEHISVADTNNHRIRVIDGDIVITKIGSTQGTDDGPYHTATLSFPVQVADITGYTLIAEQGRPNIRIYTNATQLVSTLAVFPDAFPTNIFFSSSAGKLSASISSGIYELTITPVISSLQLTCTPKVVIPNLCPDSFAAIDDNILIGSCQGISVLTSTPQFSTVAISKPNSDSQKNKILIYASLKKSIAIIDTGSNCLMIGKNAFDQHGNFLPPNSAPAIPPTYDPGSNQLGVFNNNHNNQSYPTSATTYQNSNAPQMPTGSTQQSIPGPFVNPCPINPQLNMPIPAISNDINRIPQSQNFDQSYLSYTPVQQGYANQNAPLGVNKNNHSQFTAPTLPSPSSGIPNNYLPSYSQNIPPNQVYSGLGRDGSNRTSGASCWRWKKGDGWEPYNASDNQILTEAYLQGKLLAMISSGYVVDFEKGVQYHNKTPTKTRPVSSPVSMPCPSPHNKYY